MEEKLTFLECTRIMKYNIHPHKISNKLKKYELDSMAKTLILTRFDLENNRVETIFVSFSLFLRFI